MNQEQAVQRVTHEHHSALASLKLAIYATDAMRVLRRIEVQAGLSQNFKAELMAACPDWRNPGWLEDPEGLVLSVLTYATDMLQDLLEDGAPVVANEPLSPPARVL